MRHGFGIATKRDVYRRLSDYERVGFRPEADGSVLVGNPTGHTISGLMVRLPGPVSAVMGGEEACIHLVDGTTFTLPELRPGQLLRFRPAKMANLPVITQPNNRYLEIMSAVHTPASSVTTVTARARGRSNLVIEQSPWIRAAVKVEGLDESQPRQIMPDDGRLVIPLHAPAEAFLKIVVREAT